MAQVFDMQSLEFRLPDLGEGLTEAEIVRWMVEVGDVVDVDQPVVEVETAKAMVEVPCPYGGVVTARFGEEGSELPVGAPLLTVAVGDRAEHGAKTTVEGDGGGTGAAQEDAQEGGPGGDGAREPAAAYPPPAATDPPAAGAGDTAQPGAAAPAAEEGSGNVLVGYGTSAAPARRPRVRPAPPGARALPRPAPGRHTPAPGPASGADDWDDDASGQGPVPVISPLVRRLARDHGLDLRELAGSGPDGLILRADVEYALRAASSAAARATPPATGPLAGAPGARGAAPGPRAVEAGRAAAGEDTRVPLRGVLGTLAERVTRSRAEIPDATCWVDADATELMRTRAAMNAAQGPKISVLALLARICTAALARHPQLNASVDTEAGEVVRHGAVHLGFAAQTARGLVVPVVRDAHLCDVQTLSEELGRLTGAARDGALSPGDLTGGTFTLNNYGVFGVDGSTPIINHPEAAMLGVGRITPKPWVHEGELAVRQVVQLSLTFDHRVCDGGAAGGFLRYIADCVEQPAVLLRNL
ncbi:dihydrolipoamide acetyltransferase family protein [Streptomyces sp. NPDC050560]|uniref:dihydrolipoamide acetyltransferase family protein n=1 Tax=Streptomyces sp. NPDC050560 TaxID=3365630 RepID=UPI0037A1E09E